MLSLVQGGMGGSETYARSLTRELDGHKELDVISLVARSQAGFSEGVREKILSGTGGGDSTAARLRTLAWALSDRGARASVRCADVLHYPFSVPAPRPRPGTPFVQTLHDVQHLDLPHLFTKAELLYRRVLYDRPAQHADAVITMSEFCKERIVTQLGVDSERVHVANLGVDSARFRPNFGMRDNFILYPARGWPHKNHHVLIEAMKILREDRPGLRLVLTGGALETLGDLPDWVEKRGLVAEAELDMLYQRASCLAFPSLYEGFGLPPLEAMASGCPVAAASAGSLTEVCGDAAVLFDPSDPVAVARAVESALINGQALAARGLKQVEAFTWRRCGDVHADVYREVFDVVRRPHRARRPNAV